MLKGSNKLKKVILAILSIVAILGIATTASKIANNQKAKIMPASTHVTGQYDLVQPGDENLPETPNVQFDAYFLNDSVKTRGALLGPIKGPNIVTVPQKSLYIELKVIGEGYLKDGTIMLSRTNSVTDATLITDEVINGVYVGDFYRIDLKNVSNGITKVIRLEVQPNIKNKDDFYRNDNKITLTGTYVNNNGEEIKIKKDVNYAIETIYEELNASSQMSNDLRIEYTNNERPVGQINIINTASQYFRSSNTKQKGKIEDTPKSDLFIIKDVPKFNGYKPEEIEVTAGIPSDGRYRKVDTANYDKENNTFEIRNFGFNSKLEQIRIRFIYPVESSNDEKSEEIDVVGDYEVAAYNNENYPELRMGPIKSRGKFFIRYYKRTIPDYRRNILNIPRNLTGDNLRKIYEGEEDNLPQYGDYIVSIRPEQRDKTANKIILRENQNDEDVRTRITNGRDFKEIGDLTEHTGVSFDYYGVYSQEIDENAKVEIYDNDNNELLHEFNKTEILKYFENSSNKENIFKYSRNIKNIKIILYNIKPDYKFQINTHKQLNEKEFAKRITEKEFDSNIFLSTGIDQEINGNSEKFRESSEIKRPTKNHQMNVWISMYSKDKTIEKAKYNGYDIENNKNDFTFRMDVSLGKYTKEARIESKDGMTYIDSKLNIDNKLDIEGVNFIKYKGIYFEPRANIDDDIYVKIYNSKTNENIATFLKEDIVKHKDIHTKFLYEEKFRDIKIETNKNIDIRHIVNIDTEELVNTINKEDFLKNKNYILSRFKIASITKNKPNYKEFQIVHSAMELSTQIATANAYINKPLSTHKVNKGIIQSIHLNERYGRTSIWKKNIILIEYPEEVKEIKVNEIRNMYQLRTSKILGYEQFEKNNKQYLKIYLDSDI